MQQEKRYSCTHSIFKNRQMPRILEIKGKKNKNIDMKEKNRTHRTDEKTEHGGSQLRERNLERYNDIHKSLVLEKRNK